MTNLQRHAVPPPDDAQTADRLLLRTVRLAGDEPLDPLAVLAALPPARRHALWRPPAGESDDALVGSGAALRLVVPVGDDPAAAVTALGKRLRRIFAERLERLAGEVRAFFTLAFDPGDAFGEGAERERWSGFSPVEAVVPEILVRCPAPGRQRAGGAGEALLIGTAERMPALEQELVAAVDGAREVSAGARTGPVAADRPEDLPGDLVIEWAAGRHRRAVEAALQSLRDPELSKVVLAHAVEVTRRRAFDPAALLASLRETFPGCFLFSFRPAAGPGGDTRFDGSAPAPVFLGASPERLARVRRDRPATERERDPQREPADGAALCVVSGALAGTAPRGRTADEERRHGERLLASAKDREEHAIVETMIADALEPLCSRLERAVEPTLERLDNVQHLYSPVRGRLRPGRTLFDAVAALHPTPAVGGMPRDRAMAAIRALEPTQRGLYAGVVGWVDPDGHGDSAVAIRSALVDGPRARLYAGGGIVPTSDPDVEVEEIRLKLGAILGAMKAPLDHDRSG
jgi:isochorismate synthase EntC